MPGGLSIDDTEGRLVYANPALCQMLGYSLDELVGHPILNILAGWSDDTVYEKIRKRQGGEVEYYDAQLIHRSGRLIPVQVTAAPLFDSADNLTRTFAIFLDQSELASSRQVAERSRRMYRQLFHQSKDAIVIHDPDGAIIDVNQRAMDLWGYTRAELLSLDARTLVHPDSLERTTAELEHLAEEGLLDTEVQLVRASGEVFPAEVSATLIETGTEPVVQTIVRDLSEEKHTQNILQAMSNRALLYLDILSHDISNQLQIAESSTELLGLCCTEEYPKDLLDSLRGALRRMAAIVIKTKATGRLMSATVTTRDLIEAVEKTVERAAVAYPELTITTSIQVEEALIRGDDLLEHLISNLLENAYEHNPSDDKRVWATVTPSSAGYDVRIADNGPGIPDEVKMELLQPSQRKGGLGLHMSRHIAQKYGGKLSISDRVPGHPEQGAEVRVWLPAAAHSI